MICGFEFDDGYICMQSDGHEKFDVPHLRYGEGVEYWAERRTENYCDLCEKEGHTFRTCPTRDDESLYEEDD